jgi:hypothetical protein
VDLGCDVTIAAEGRGVVADVEAIGGCGCSQSDGIPRGSGPVRIS